MPDGQILFASTKAVRPRLTDAGALALLVVLACLLRLTSLVPAAVDIDEGLFMVQAREWLAGGWPLVAAWDMHPVGAPALFAVAFGLLGTTVEAARLLGMACVAATACALYGAARAAGAPARIGIGAGVVYAAHSVLFGGLATSTELLIAPFLVGAMAIALRGAARAEPPGWSALSAMGLLVGLALVVKQVAVPEGCLVFAVLLLPALLRRLVSWRRAGLMALAYAGLCAAPFLLGALVYWSQGWLAEYLDGSILAPFRYSMERIAGAEAWRRIGAALLQLGLAIAAAGVAVAVWRPRPAMPPAALLTGVAALWLCVAGAAIAAPGFYFAHYFLLLLPPLSLLAALGVWWIAATLARPQHAQRVFAVLVAVLATQGWLPEASARLDRGPGWMHRDPVREVAAAVARLAGPGGDAFVANYHPSVYVLAGVRIATRFPFPPHLTGEFEDLSDTNTEVELDRVLAARPRVIVVDRGWMHTMRPAAAAKVLAAVAEGYDLAATVAEQRGPVEIFRARPTAPPG